MNYRTKRRRRWDIPCKFVEIRRKATSLLLRRVGVCKTSYKPTSIWYVVWTSHRRRKVVSQPVKSTCMHIMIIWLFVPKTTLALSAKALRVSTPPTDWNLLLSCYLGEQIHWVGFIKHNQINLPINWHFGRYRHSIFASCQEELSNEYWVYQRQLVRWLSGRTSVSDRRTFTGLHLTCSWW